MRASDAVPTWAAGVPALGAMLIIAGVALVLGLLALWLARRHTHRERRESTVSEQQTPPDGDRDPST